MAQEPEPTLLEDVTTAIGHVWNGANHASRFHRHVSDGPRIPGKLGKVIHAAEGAGVLAAFAITALELKGHVDAARTRRSGPNKPQVGGQ